jgi:hypothetical protein
MHPLEIRTKESSNKRHTAGTKKEAFGTDSMVNS